MMFRNIELSGQYLFGRIEMMGVYSTGKEENLVLRNSDFEKIVFYTFADGDDPVEKRAMLPAG